MCKQGKIRHVLADVHVVRKIYHLPLPAHCDIYHYLPTATLGSKTLKLGRVTIHVSVTRLEEISSV